MKYIYSFSEGNQKMKDLLGGKGANLAEMTNLGLPVPPDSQLQQRFVIIFEKNEYPAGFEHDLNEKLDELEHAIKNFWIKVESTFGFG